jgi:lipid II:glycine glycyltransferase (peptidoglycan interpeptide bridge formation enzyme)
MKLELRNAEAAACDRSRSFLQSAFWGEFKSENGWKARHFAMTIQGEESSPLLVLERRFGHGFSFAYIPHGPSPAGPAGIAPPEAGRGGELLAELSKLLAPRLSKECVFIRYDPPWFVSDSPAPRVGPPMRRAATDVQPPDTVFLDLSPSEEEILSRMKPKWRYNIRLAAKKGVRVVLADSEGLGDFYRLYEETAARDRIALHPERYYAALFDLAGRYSGEIRRPDLRLWFAEHEGERLASIITLFWGEQAIYLYGASSERRRNLMPAYALQWEAIRAAKAASCLEYDMFGIPPDGDHGHPMAGLYRFKTGFGGRIVHRPGSWDYPLKPGLYAAFRAAEAARAWWHKGFKKSFARAGQGV